MVKKPFGKILEKNSLGKKPFKEKKTLKKLKKKLWKNSPIENKHQRFRKKKKQPLWETIDFLQKKTNSSAKKKNKKIDIKLNQTLEKKTSRTKTNSVEK